MEFINDRISGSGPVISGGVVQDSSGNIISNDASSYLSPTYSQINSYDKAKSYETSSPGVLENPGFQGYYVDLDGNLKEKTANETLNDVSRGESSNLESSKDYLERITGIIANGIYTAKEQNALNLSEAEKVREYNRIEAEKARAYQLMLRDTQIQSTMKQLKDAGINPLLAFGSLGYANSSSPAQASSSHTTFGNDNSIVSALILAVASAIGSLTKLIGLAPGDITAYY